MCHSEADSSPPLNQALSETSGLAGTALALRSGVTRESKKYRRKLWQIEQHFLCSVIGTCLSPQELRNIARKAGLCADPDITDYELHSYFVNDATEASLRILHKHLEKKFKRYVNQHMRLHCDKDLLNAWQQALASGDIAGVYWSLVTHSRVTIKFLNILFGDIHMLSHLSGASVRSDIKKLHEVERTLKNVSQQHTEELVALSQRLAQKEEALEKLRTVDAENSQLKARLAKSDQRVAELEKRDRQAQLEKVADNLATQLHSSVVKVRKATDRIHALTRQLRGSESEIQKLQGDLDLVKEDRRAAEVALTRCLNNPVSMQEDALQSPCIGPDLQGQKVLFVGGHPSQNSWLRRVVELSNGDFIYHDGGKEQNQTQLMAALSQADVVFCPQNCVSHDAYYRSKKYCKQACKKLIMLPQSSVSAFISGLNTLAANDQ